MLDGETRGYNPEVERKASRGEVGNLDEMFGEDLEQMGVGHGNSEEEESSEGEGESTK